MADHALPLVNVHHLVGRILQHYNLLSPGQFETATREYESQVAAGTAVTGAGGLGDFLCQRGYLSVEQGLWLAQALQLFEAQVRRQQEQAALAQVVVQPITSEATLQSADSSFSGWGQAATQSPLHSAAVLTRLGTMDLSDASAPVLDLSAISAIGADASNRSQTSGPATEPAESASAQWGSLPLAAVAVSRPQVPVVDEEDRVQNPWGDLPGQERAAPPEAPPSIAEPPPLPPPPAVPARETQREVEFNPAAEVPSPRAPDGAERSGARSIEAAPQVVEPERSSGKHETSAPRSLAPVSEVRPAAPRPLAAGRIAIGVLRPSAGQRRDRRRDEKSSVPVEIAREQGRPPRGEEAPAPPEIERLLQEAQRQGASDLHLPVGSLPLLRVDGELRALGPVVPTRPLLAETTEQFLTHALTLPQRRALREQQELTFMFDAPAGLRVRATVLGQPRGMDLVLRLVPSRVPALEELGLPAVVPALLAPRRGVLVWAAPAGHGLTTTLAAVLDHLGRARPARILSLEDPIEHRPAVSVKSCLQQRQLGRHCQSYARALHTALHSDFDVVAVAAVPDEETLRLALELAQDGRLVLLGVCAGGARQALEQLRALGDAALGSQLGQALGAVVTQRLARRTDGTGRVVAAEVLPGSPGVAVLLRDGSLEGLRSQAQRDRAAGVQFLDETLLALVRAGTIPSAEARAQLQIPGFVE